MIGLAKEIIDIGGDAEAVGVQYFKATKDHPPIRVFYPADNESIPKSSRPIRWFEDTGSLSFLKGYAHLAICRHDTKLSRFLVVPILSILSFFLPMRWLRLSGVYKDAPIAKKWNNANDDDDNNNNKTRLPVIVFSHGLTGTGQENKVLCAQWAKQGFLVVSVHHTDGSSCNVQLEDGSQLYYKHGPPMTEYDATFRPRQVEQRAQELLQAHQFVFSRDDFGRIADAHRVVVAGFSYGAATAAKTVTMKKNLFRGAIFLDGWFHIDVRESAGIEFKFPKEAFEKDGFRPNFPRLFINSEQFQHFTDIFAATQELAGKDNAVHVIPGTGHQNFCDVVFWFGDKLVRKLMMGAVGPTSPAMAYKEIVEVSIKFLTKTVAA